YLWEIAPGNQVLLTSLVYPVLVNDEFRGVSGVDLNLPVLQTLLQAQADKLYEGKAELYLLSKFGLVLASNRFGEQLGQPLRQLDPKLAEHLKQQQSGVSSFDGKLLVTLPIQSSSTSSGWTVVVAVPEQVALAIASQ